MNGWNVWDDDLESNTQIICVGMCEYSVHL